MASLNHLSSRQISWEDCETGARYLLDTRTGLMRAQEEEANTSSSRARLSLPSRPSIRSAANSLRRATSRVFERAEAAVHADNSRDARPVLPSDADITPERLSRALVIKQIDRKMVLVLCHPTVLACQERSQLLLIDQHAADERIRLERIIKALITDTRANQVLLEKRWAFPVTQAEADRLHAHAAWFAQFGVTIEVTINRETGEKRAEVLYLPACIYERAWEDPNLVLLMLKQDSLLRDAPPAASTPPSLSSALALAPPSLVEMIKSQACRSAIMFNDFLSDDQCRGLVRDLALCENPFRCAHNRPTMVRVGGGPQTAWAGDMVGLGI